MGFDIECIIDIHTYPGEYFCPVCRTLVYPNETFQSQCTHLYCKPCLTHIANGTKACPYDGYLVTEADSKPLMDSDKALAENIGKVKVHCLYFRSGCTWEGLLSECTSHCSACTFGNSPVICNRCGIQIVHRQVHDHAQSCPGVYGGQQAAGLASGTTRSVTTASSATSEANQTTQSVAPQVQTSQIVAATPVPGQNPIQQVNVNSQAPAVAPVSVPTPDQWYQQQYQQYYQQYMGYYQQQPNQQYYQFQQQPYQQYQQHPAQVPGQVQAQVVAQSVPQVQPHLQPQAQAQAQAQAQLQSQSQPQQQPHLQPQAQVQAQQQSQLHLPTPVQPQVQVPPQPHLQGQAPSGLLPNYQVNPQQPPQPPLRLQTQTLRPTLNHSAQPPQFPPGIGMRPPAQPPQVPQYQQPHHQSSQFHVQPHMQPLPQPLSSNLPHVQAQPQVQPYPTPSPAPVFPPQANQAAAPTALPQAPNPPAPPASGHHSYQQPNPTQKMQPGSSQQHPVHPHPVNAAAHHAQVPQQPGVMRPPAQVSMPLQQPSTLLPPQNQVPFIPPQQHQQFPPNAQHTHSFQNRPVMQPVQQALPLEYSQQQHFPAPPLQSQFHQQLSIQPQQRPFAPAQLQPPLNYTGRPMMPNQGIHSQNHPFSSDVGSLVHSGPVELSSTQIPTNQKYTKPTVLEHNETGQEARSPSRALGEKSVEGEIPKEKVVTGQSETIGTESDNASKDVGNKSAVKQEEDNVHGLLEQASVRKTFEAGTASNEVPKMEGHGMGDSDLLNQVHPENQKLSTAVGPSSVNYDNKSQTTISASGTECHLLSQQSQGSHLRRPEVQVHGQEPSVPEPQGVAGVLLHPGQSLNPDERRAHGYYGPPKGFDPQYMPHGPTHPTQAYPHGVMGRMPLHEGQMSKDQMPGGANPAGMGEGAVPKAREPGLFRTNGVTASELMFGSKDGKMTAISQEPLNSLPGEPTHPFDQASRSLDKVPHGPINEAGSKMNPGAFGPHPRFLPPNDPLGGHGNIDMFGQGAEFGQHHLKHFPRGSPGREYFGSSRGFGEPTSFPRGGPAFDDITSREPHRFGEGSRPFNVSSDRAGNPFHDGRFPPLSGHPQGDLGGSGNPRFGEHRAPGSDNVFGPDGPGNLARGKFSGSGYFPGNFGVAESAGPGPFPGHGRGRELGVPTNFPRPPFNESVRGDRFAHFGEPTMHNNYPLPGFPNTGIYSGGMDSFESWKRKPISNGWCRICEVDCESVEGLELHSQSREHQKRSMDIVKSIKLQNKKQRTGGPMMHDGGSRNRKPGVVGRGSNT